MDQESKENVNFSDLLRIIKENEYALKTAEAELVHYCEEHSDVLNIVFNNGLVNYSLYFGEMYGDDLISSYKTHKNASGFLSINKTTGEVTVKTFRKKMYGIPPFRWHEWIRDKAPRHELFVGAIIESLVDRGNSVYDERNTVTHISAMLKAIVQESEVKEVMPDQDVE